MLSNPACKLYLPLESGSVDYSGNGNNGTPTNAAYDSGKVGTAFDGAAGRYIEFSSGIVPLGTKTIAFWWNPKSGNVLYSTVFSNARDTNTQGTLLWYNSSTQMSWRAGGNGSVFTLNFTAPTVGAWSHIALVRDGSSTRVYVNAVQAASTTSSGSESAAVYNFALLALRGYPLADYNALGYIDEFAVFDKALAQWDISRLMLGLHPISI